MQTHETLKPREPEMMTQAMLAQADRFPLFLGDPQAMLAKLQAATGVLAEHWEQYQTQLKSDPEARQKMLPLWAALTGEDMAEAKSVLRDGWASLITRDLDHAVQKHTWCVCGSQMRLAAFTDWLHSREPFSQTELEQAATAHIGLAMKHAYATMTSRVISADNQNLAMTLYATVVGYLFGHKLTQHASGQFLFAYGLQRLPMLLGMFPRDGYAGEGSTYTSHVNTPLFCWLHQLLTTLGQAQADQPYAPNGATLHKLIGIESRLVGPTGLMLPWDHYGWFAASNGAPLAYLAGMEADAAIARSYLGVIDELAIGKTPGMMAWGNDNPMWTLVWWPAAYSDYKPQDADARDRSWCLPRTGASLADEQRRTRLVQVWDRSAEVFTSLGRAQVNPNHLMFEVQGEAVFQDGIPIEGHTPFDVDMQKAVGRLSEDAQRRLANYASGSRDKVSEQFVRHQACGMLGSANAIVIDHENEYWPGTDRTGRAVAFGTGEHLRAITADATAIYQPGFDVRKMQRTSIWNTRYGIGLVLDEIEADANHVWTWQAYLRPTSALNQNHTHVRVDLPNKHHVTFAWAGTDGESSPIAALEQVHGYPKSYEAASARLTLDQAGSQARFAVAMGVDAEAVQVQAVGRGRWEIQAEGQTHVITLNEDSSLCTWTSQGQVDELLMLPADDGHVDCFDVNDWDNDDTLASIACHAFVTTATDGKHDWLERVDRCYALLARGTNDQDAVALLSEAIASEDWPVVCAGADVAGRLGCGALSLTLRARLQKEQAIAHEVRYPPDSESGCSGSPNRWRVSAALIAALGRLGDTDAGPMIGEILDRGEDFYPVQSVAAQALGKMQWAGAWDILDRTSKDPEVNSAVRSSLAMRLLGQGRIINSHAG